MASASPDDESVSLGPGLRHSPSPSALDLGNRSFAKHFVFRGGGKVAIKIASSGNFRAFCKSLHKSHRAAQLGNVSQKSEDLHFFQCVF